MKIYVLMNKDGQVVMPGAKVVDFRGEEAVLEGGRPPEREGSTGRVWTDAGEYFPSVYGLKWVLV